jgi:hypothetical protein
MSQCVVVCYDKELRAPFKAAPPMLDGFAYGQKLLNRAKSKCCHAHLDSAPSFMYRVAANVAVEPVWIATG